MLDFPVGATVSEGLLVQAGLLQSLADRKRLGPSFRRPKKVTLHRWKCMQLVLVLVCCWPTKREQPSRHFGSTLCVHGGSNSNQDLRHRKAAVIGGDGLRGRLDPAKNVL